MAKKATLCSIAELAGCSAAVVSRVLNHTRGTTKVSEAMANRIREIAARENYRPNFASRSLKSNRSRTLGVYVQPSLWHGLGRQYEMSIFCGIERAAMAHGYDLLILNMSCSAATAVCGEKLAEHRIDGVLLLHAEPGADWVRELAAAHPPVVAVDYNKPEPGLDTVSFDNADAALRALRHLQSLGHRRIGFIGHTPPRTDWDGTQREDAFLAARNDPAFAGMELLFHTGSGIRPDSPYCQLEGEEGIRHYLAMKQPPSAVIGYNSLVALSALYTARQLGVAVPGALSLIGIDNHPGDWFGPALTCVEHPLTDMGEVACELLIAKIEARDSALQRRFHGTLLHPDLTTAPKGE